MLKFNTHGYLEPYEAIQTDTASTKEFLVWNEARKEIWANFEAFICELQEVLANPFTLWLNGSFATKKEKPNDMDLLVFVDYRVYDKNISTLSQVKNTFKKLKIDSYFVPYYPKEHSKNYIFELDKKEWFYLFGSTRRDVFSGLRYPKGFLELKF